METESKQQILERRKELEQELVDMFKETDPTSPRLRRGKEQFTLQHVKDAIFHEEDNDDMMKVVAMFDPSSRTQGVHYGASRGGDASEFTPLESSLSLTGLSNVLELVTDAWNYFPHKVLGGISPAEKLLEHPQ